MSLSTIFEYRDLKRRTTRLEILLLVGAVVAVWSLWSSCLQIDLLTGGGFTVEQADANDAREQMVGIVSLVLYLVTALVFCRWVHRAHANLDALGAEGLEFTPGWAVGFFFVPVMNLWKPYEAMKDLWAASHDPERWRALSPGDLVSVWWFLWVVGNLAGTVVLRLTGRADTIDALTRLSYFDAGLEILHVVLCLVTVRMVSEIADAQERTADQRQRSSGSAARREVPAALRYDPPARGGSVRVR
jgi:hypothetical protein